MTPMKWRNCAKSMHQVYLMKSMVPSSMTQDKALQKNKRNCKESVKSQNSAIKEVHFFRMHFTDSITAPTKMRVMQLIARRTEHQPKCPIQSVNTSNVTL